MADLIAPLTNDQMALLRCISGPLAEHGQYPVWQYVEAELDRQDLDAWELLLSLPVAGVRTPGAQYYGLVASDLNPSDDSRPQLTIAGFYQLPEFREKIGGFFVRLLSFLIERRKFAPASPFKVTRLEVTRKEIISQFPSLSPFLRTLLPGLFQYEPATWGGTSWIGTTGEEWSHAIGRRILKYQGVTSVREYLLRVSELLTPAAVTPPPAVPSPLDLVAALKYFNTVWELHFGQKIMENFDPERSARLAFGVDTADEFSSQVSTLAEIIKNLRSNGDPNLYKTGLARMEAKLKDELPADAHARVAAAVGNLGNISKVRNAMFQHSGTEYRGLQALSDLGIVYPIADWDAAWRSVERKMIDALQALREELQQFHESQAN